MKWRSLALALLPLLLLPVKKGKVYPEMLCLSLRAEAGLEIFGTSLAGSNTLQVPKYKDIRFKVRWLD